jgi:hypothetical protein
MKFCCFYNMFFSAIFGFFLCFFIIGTQLIKENEKEKHDHKTCQKCVCEKKCNCPHEKEPCETKCLCD